MLPILVNLGVTVGVREQRPMATAVLVIFAGNVIAIAADAAKLLLLKLQLRFAPAPGMFRVLVLFGRGVLSEETRNELAPRGFRLFKPVQLLPRDEFARIQATVEIEKEDAAYAECKAFILNIDASAADPARAQACANIMSMIDRARAERQAHADRQQDRAQREAELDEFRRQRELDRQTVEQQARRAEQLERRRAIGEAIRSMTAPPPQATTRCSFSSGNSSCTTTSY